MTPGIKIGLCVVGAVTALALLRARPWERDAAVLATAAGNSAAAPAHREQLRVGFLPVT